MPGGRKTTLGAFLPSILNRASSRPKTSSSALITTFLPHLPRTLCLVFAGIILHAAVPTILAAVMHGFKPRFPGGSCQQQMAPQAPDSWW
jgi:hypothetical protein